MDPGSDDEGTANLAPNGAGRMATRVESVRVCQILYSGLGGHGAVAFSLLQAPQAHRWAPLMAFIGVEPLRESYAQSCERLGVPYASFRQEPGAPWDAWRRLFCWLMRENPDVVLLHSTTAIGPSFLFRALRNARLVMIEHTPDNAKSRLERLLGLLAHALADRIVLLTPNAATTGRDFLALLGTAKKRVIIPNGVDLRIFEPAETQRTTGAVVRLGMAGRFSRLKRQDLLIGALKHLARRHPHAQYRLSLAGSGETLEAVQAQARHLGVSDRVEFCGPLDETRLAEWFRSLNLYLHASDSEVMSTSVLQAMASGLAIVGSDIESIRRQIEPEPQCGLLVDRQDGAAFAEATLRLIDDAELRQRFAQASRVKAETDYGSAAMFEAYDALLRGLVVGRSRGARRHSR